MLRTGDTLPGYWPERKTTTTSAVFSPSAMHPTAA